MDIFKFFKALKRAFWTVYGLIMASKQYYVPRMEPRSYTIKIKRCQAPQACSADIRNCQSSNQVNNVLSGAPERTAECDEVGSV